MSMESVMGPQTVNIGPDLVLHQLDAGELQGPHQVAAEEKEPGAHQIFRPSYLSASLRIS